MIHLKKFVLFCMLICLPVLIQAQQVILRSSVQMKFRVPYHNSDGGKNTYNNIVLREMAKDVVREPWQVKIQVAYKLSLIITQQGDKTQLAIYFTNPVVSGDNVFRRFQISDVLLPPKICMKLKWANRFDTTSFSEATLTGKSMEKDDGLVGFFPIAAFDPQVDTLMIRDAELSYDSLTLVTFKERLELIHDYYASVLLLDSLDQMAAEMHLDNPASLPLNYLRIEEFNKVIERIQARDFPATLLVGGFDPARLTEKYNAMYRHSRTLTYNFIDKLKKTGSIPWNRNIDDIAGYFTDRVFSYVMRSKLMDHLQSRIYQEWLDLCFDRSSFPPEEKVIGTLLSKMYPGDRADTIAGYVSGRIYESYQDKARQLMNQHQFSEAFSMMENARRFVERNPSILAVTPDYDILSKAAYGIYNSYTGIAQECIRNKKYNMADTYLARADQYAREHASLITSDSLYHAVFGGLFFMRNSECDQLLEQDRFRDAIDCYNSFESKYSSRELSFVKDRLDEKKNKAMTGLFRESAIRLEDALDHRQEDTALFYYEQAATLRKGVNGDNPSFSILDSLAPMIARIRYVQFFNSAVHALDQRQFTLALNQFSEAKKLSDQYRLIRELEFDSLYRRTMKFCLIIQLSAAQKKIWANKFDSAYMALDQTKSAGFNWGLLNDQEFSNALSRFETRIREQQCRNIRDSVNYQLICADRSIALKNYLKASGYMQQALVINAKAGQCGFSDQPVRDSLAKFSRVTAYQQRLLDARSHVATGEYSVAVVELDENEMAYQLYRLDRFGVSLEGVYDFISDRSNPYLTEQAISYYSGRGNHREAMRFLRLLRIQGFSDRSVETIQRNLGKTLAADDLRVNPKDTALHFLEQYTSNDAWFEVFRSTYLEEWNRLAKKAPAVK